MNRNLLRQRLSPSTGDMIIAPGVYDCITARLVEQSGFEAAYMTGSGTAAAFGFPDYGLLCMSEMVGNAGRIANSLDIPLIADADTGYGNELNVTRTVREYERAAVAAIHIEDQEFPKRCGHLDNKKVVPLDDFLSKIRAATAARCDSDLVIIARTDARAILGFEEAVRRANLAIQAGADVAFIEAPQSIDEVAEVPRQVDGPCLLNLVWAGKTPDVSFAEAQDMGYRIAILPGMLLAGVMLQCEALLAATHESMRHPELPVQLNVQEIFRRMGSDDWDRLRVAYRDTQSGTAV